MPYCPLCQREPDTPDSRCPLDRVFYVQARCPACAAEVLPKERFCGACGRELGGEQARVAAELAPASVPARLAATAMDGLALLIVYELWASVAPYPLEAMPALALAWWTLLQVGAGQTLGQHVLGQVVLTQDRQQLTLTASLKRTLLSAVPLQALRAVLRPDGRTAAEVWTGTHTWADQRR